MLSRLRYLPVTVRSALCFHGQVPSQQVQPWGAPSCKQQTRVPKTGPVTPRAEALGKSYQPKHCAPRQPPSHVPKHTCTAAGHSAVPPPPGHSSTVTLATAELLGSQAVCHGQMATCRHLETPVPPSISSQAPHPPASSDALLFAPCPGPYPLEYLVLADSHQAGHFPLTPQPEEHHGVTVSSDRSPQHASPEVSL